MLFRRSNRSGLFSGFQDLCPVFRVLFRFFPNLSIKKSPAVQGIPFPKSFSVEISPFSGFSPGELSSGAGSADERTLFLRNSNKFPATDVCLHVMSYSADFSPLINAAAPVKKDRTQLMIQEAAPFNMPSADHFSCQHTIRLSPARTLCGCPSRFTSASTVCFSYSI